MSLCRAPGVGKGSVDALLRYGSQHNLSHEQCLQGSGLDVSYHSADIDVTPQQELLVIANIIKFLGKPFATGFAIGISYRIGDLGTFGLALMSSKNGAHAANITARYLQAAYHFTNFKLLLLDGKIKIKWDETSAFSKEIEQFLIARDFGICRLIQNHVSSSHPRDIYEISFRFDYLSGMDEVAKAFKCAVRHNQTETYIVSESSQLEIRPPFSNPANAHAIEKSYLDILNRKDEQLGLINKVKQKLMSEPCLNIQKKQMADLFHMSERTFSRHLEKESSSWRLLITEARLEKAELLLKISNKPLQKISDEVGFSSVSSLSHAFTKYKGMSPTEFRKGLKELQFN